MSRTVATVAAELPSFDHALRSEHRQAKAGRNDAAGLDAPGA